MSNPGRNLANRGRSRSKSSAYQHRPKSARNRPNVSRCRPNIGAASVEASAKLRQELGRNRQIVEAKPAHFGPESDRCRPSPKVWPGAAERHSLRNTDCSTSHRFRLQPPLALPSSLRYRPPASAIGKADHRGDAEPVRPRGGLLRHGRGLRPLQLGQHVLHELDLAGALEHRCFEKLLQVCRSAPQGFPGRNAL